MMDKEWLEFDFETPVKHLHRAEGPDTSIEAAHSIDPTRLEGMVLGVITRIQPCISDEVRGEFPGYSYSSITARYKALHTKGLINYTGEKRPGESGRRQRVMVAADPGVGVREPNGNPAPPKEVNNYVTREFCSG